MIGPENTAGARRAKFEALFQRAVRFGLSGLVVTAVSYVTFIGFMKVANYVVAGTLSWVFSLLVGFALNRRITFGFKGQAGLSRHAILFAVGAILQYAVAMAGYAVLIGIWRLDPTVAFGINLVLTTTFSFSFHSLVTFRR